MDLIPELSSPLKFKLGGSLFHLFLQVLDDRGNLFDGNILLFDIRNSRDSEIVCLVDGSHDILHRFLNALRCDLVGSVKLLLDLSPPVRL